MWRTYMAITIREAIEDWFGRDKGQESQWKGKNYSRIFWSFPKKKDVHIEFIIMNKFNGANEEMQGLKL